MSQLGPSLETRNSEVLQALACPSVERFHSQPPSCLWERSLLLPCSSKLLPSSAGCPDLSGVDGRATPRSQPLVGREGLFALRARTPWDSARFTLVNPGERGGTTESWLFLKSLPPKRSRVGWGRRDQGSDLAWASDLLCHLVWVTYPFLFSNSSSVKWGIQIKAVDFEFIKQSSTLITWNLVKNFTFYNREAESFWLILGCRGVLGFLLVFQIIPWKHIIRTPQEPNLKTTEKDALNGPSGSDHLAPHSAVLGLAVAPGGLLGRQFQVFFKSYWIRTHILKFSRSPDLRSTGLHTQLGVTSNQGSIMSFIILRGPGQWVESAGRVCLKFPMFQCISCPLDGEPAMGNSEACPWLSWGGPRWDI